MAETIYPLLVFPRPIPAERAKRGGGPNKINLPRPSDQARRLTPQFQRLQEALDRQSFVLRDNPLGLQPEQVLVLETIGSIDNFANVVRYVPGLEWLGESELHDIRPAHGFEDSKNADKDLRGQLFLVMSDQAALRQLRNLFNQWKNDPDMTFRRGLAPLKAAFLHLREIRPWGPEDRISETGIMEDLEARLQDGQEVIPFEVELWYRHDAQQREKAVSHLRALIASMDGEITQQCALHDIAYHAILGQAPRDHVLGFVRRRDAPEDIELLSFDGIKHLRPVGQCTVGPFDSSTETDALPEAPIPGGPSGDPLVALLDGMPLARHKRLEDWVDIDDPDGYEGSYLARERVHGTSMASLICHGGPGRRARADRTPAVHQTHFEASSLRRQECLMKHDSR